MLLGLTIEQFLKILAGLVTLAGAGAWLNHFFASGEVRLADRRKDKDANQARIIQLENDLKAARRLQGYEVEVKHSAVLQLNRLSWAYDDLRERLILVCDMAGGAIPEVLCEKCRQTPPAAEILREANEVIQGLHIAFTEAQEADK